ncbi:MAG: sulfotransferase [Flavobacteriales bacterium]|nr:sulfotransferase [Flavobacteriales bacterium]
MKRIAIHGVPRSGTTWVGALFDSCPTLRYVTQPLFSYAFKGRLDLSSSKQDIERFFEDIAASSDEFINQTPQKQSKAIPVFDKQQMEAICYKEARYHHLIPHLLETDPELFVFLIVRNPMSVIASWEKAPKEFDPENMDLMEEWRGAQKKNQNRPEEWYGFDKWKEFAHMALAMAERFPERCCIIEYHELLRDTGAELRSYFAFCGIPFEEQTGDFIAESRSKDMTTDAYAVFRVKQVDDQWKGSLPAPIVDAIRDELDGTELQRFLYEV